MKAWFDTWHLLNRRRATGAAAPSSNVEIRVLNDDLTTRAIVAQQYINDGAAIRSARRFAEPHDCEVWRGLTCVWNSARPASERAV
jgi:hypothetical protein